MMNDLLVEWEMPQESRSFLMLVSPDDNMCEVEVGSLLCGIEICLKATQSRGMRFEGAPTKQYRDDNVMHLTKNRLGYSISSR